MAPFESFADSSSIGLDHDELEWGRWRISFFTHAHIHAHSLSYTHTHSLLYTHTLSLTCSHTLTRSHTRTDFHPMHDNVLQKVRQRWPLHFGDFCFDFKLGKCKKKKISAEPNNCFYDLFSAATLKNLRLQGRTEPGLLAVKWAVMPRWPVFASLWFPK